MKRSVNNGQHDITDDSAKSLCDIGCLKVYHIFLDGWMDGWNHKIDILVYLFLYILDNVSYFSTLQKTFKHFLQNSQKSHFSGILKKKERKKCDTTAVSLAAQLAAARHEVL